MKNVSAKIMFIVILLTASIATAADSGMWTWVSGSNTFDQNGVYGTKGVAASGNMPGARYASVSWIDSNDNLWLFGGYGYVGPEMGMEIGNLSDLWKFDGTNWTWVSGTNTFNNYGNYGTKGAANPDNIPSARLDSIKWTDSNGNFWLFGGAGFDKNGDEGYLNDLWMFDGTNWTWVNGSDTRNQAGIYGNIGETDADNMPGGRSGSVTWIDSDNNLWLFGGMGYDTNDTFGRLNDLWKFDGTNWTWISGSDFVDQPGVYGTMGAAEHSNVPGGRFSGVSWADDDGNFWLFGGRGFDESGFKFLNDLWKFDGANWTWVSGSNIGNQPGIYGTTGTAEPDNVPGGRMGSASWIDEDGNVWLFGGYGYDVNNVLGNLNDLWKFNGTNWTWVSGLDSVGQQGIYGTKGVPAIGNIPWAKRYNTAWKDSNDNLWLFGGMGGLGPAFFNDLWKFSNPVWQFGNIPGQTKNVKLTVNDDNNTPVTFSLTGGGYGEVRGGASFDRITLYGTGDKSLLTIKSNAPISIGRIICDGSLKSIAAKTTDLRKDITIDGSLGALTLKNALGGTIAIGTSLNPKATATIVLDCVTGVLDIRSNMPIKSITATDWNDGDINATWVGNITIKGDKKRSIAGNFGADIDIFGTGNPKGFALSNVKVAGTITGGYRLITGNCGTVQMAASDTSFDIEIPSGNLSALKVVGNKTSGIAAVLKGHITCNSIKSISTVDINNIGLTLIQAPDLTGKILALGSLVAKGQINNCQISSTGNIGTVTAGKMVNSICFAGAMAFRDVNAHDEIPDLPYPADLDEITSIKSIKITGIKGETNCFINSNIAASKITSVYIAYPAYDNSGAPFGICVFDSLKSLKIKNADGKTTSWSSIGGVTIPPTLPGNMQIRMD